MVRVDADYWRVHEEDYRAFAAGCSNPQIRELWLTFAEYCAEHAARIEQLGEESADGTSSGVAEPGAWHRSVLAQRAAATGWLNSGAGFDHGEHLGTHERTRIVSRRR